MNRGKEWDWMYFNDEWNEHDGSPFPIRKSKRIKNEIKRNKIKNNRGRSQGSGATDKGGEGSDN